LQIFNSKLVLASPETASDADYAAILGVIGHEVCNYHINKCGESLIFEKPTSLAFVDCN
jgi:aminopeptidase N